jgi:hypothetical protein
VAVAAIAGSSEPGPIANLSTAVRDIGMYLRYWEPLAYDGFDREEAADEKTLPVVAWLTSPPESPVGLSPI